MQLFGRNWNFKGRITMSSVNKAIILGRLGQDPEIRYMPNGLAACNLSIATSEQWKDKQTGEKKEKTEWHRISLFDRTAEIAVEFLKKGSMVYIEGRIETRKWTDKEGIERYTTEIKGDKMQLLGNRDSSAPASAPSPNSATPSASPAPVEPDDDIPF